MFGATAESSAATSTFPYTIETNPYRAKRTWPPDFDNLNSQYQLRLERRFRRRTKLKWARPRFMAWTKIAQWVLPIGVIAYTVLYMDTTAGSKGEPGPFDGIRKSYQALADPLFRHTSHVPESIPRDQAQVPRSAQNTKPT